MYWEIDPMLYQLTLKGKFLSMCAGLSLIMAGIGFTNYAGLNQVASTYAKVSHLSLPKVAKAQDLYLEYRRIRITLRTLGLSGISPQEAKQAVVDTIAAIEGYETFRNDYLTLPIDQREKALFDKVDSTWRHFKAVGSRVLELHNSGGLNARQEIFNLFMKDCPEAAKAYTAAIHELVAYNKNLAEAWSAEADAIAQNKNLLSLGIIISGLLASSILGLYFASATSRQIGGVVQGLSAGTRLLADSAGEVASASQNLSSNSTQQASALQETTSAVEETNSMIERNAESARQSENVTVSSRRTATEGREAVNQMIRGIEEISRSNDQIMTQIEAGNREIGEIVKVIAEIGNKTKVINDIVFQTKLLSFNASVEAARAGEAGKGFAVVAEEVGNLAIMSGNSAREISSMLESGLGRVESIISNTSSRVERLVGEGRLKVEAGTALARRCGELLEEIVSSVDQVGRMVSDISNASQQQFRGIGEITKAVSELEQAAQRNNSSARETATTAELMREQVLRIQSLSEDLEAATVGRLRNQNTIDHRRRRPRGASISRRTRGDEPSKAA